MEQTTWEALPPEHREGLRRAVEAREGAYVPYSHFAVGAAVRTGSGAYVQGFNIENAAYPLSMCAERVALYRAYAEGEREFRALYVVADAPRPVPPCGACRQVMAELCPPTMPVILANLRGEVLLTTVEELLPFFFAPDDLLRQEKGGALLGTGEGNGHGPSFEGGEVRSSETGAGPRGGGREGEA
ncbi:cytidine deaminase [Brockia lithotrophica]|uniref:Cytidine deaminase n=1 Tax=Brockia lithotrophica TaxID=933949 RepID=A0A660L6Z4_9BACL|nr:cytidine deaminase [Brockia lithotrophica]